MSAPTQAERAPGRRLSLILRSTAFNVVAALWTLILVVVATLALLLPRGAVLRISRIWMAGVQFLLRHLAGLRYEVRGRTNMPHEPAIYAFKHQSAWETLVVHLLVPGGAIALKRELMAIPLFGWCLRRSGMIGVDRDRGMHALHMLVNGARAAFARGNSVIIFPEGHRIPPGRHVRYHPGVAAIYGQLERPVVPVAHNSGLFWGRRSFIKRPGTIVVQFLEPIAPGMERKAFMAELHARLEGAADRLIDEAGGPESFADAIAARGCETAQAGTEA